MLNGCARRKFAMKILLSVTFFAFFGYALAGFGPGEQSWGHIPVRNGTYLFYWLYYTTAPVEHYTERPLILWLQGGPGSSSTGFGNFEELGPLRLDLENREHTWVKDFNVLFIDSPVGAGFSYVESEEQYPKNNTQVAMDLVNFVKKFYALKPEFKSVNLHIFSESYGGKAAIELALELYRSVQSKEIECSLKSVALGNAFISPIDFVLSWAPFLFQMGLVDNAGHDQISAVATKFEQLLAKNETQLSSKLWTETQNAVKTSTHGVDWYNVVRKVVMTDENDNEIESVDKKDSDIVDYNIRDELLEKLMRTNVSRALNITHVTWGVKSEKIFEALSKDFMVPAISTVEAVLNETDVNVVVYSGNLDLICSTAGTVKWINRMQWKHKNQYEAAPRMPFGTNAIIDGYVKEFGRFSMFWVNRAGHMVPEDNPKAMSYILQSVTGLNLTLT